MYEKEEPWFKIYNKLNIPKEINIDDNENLAEYNSGCNTAGDDVGSEYKTVSHIYYYWVAKYFDKELYHNMGIRWLCANGIPQNSKHGIVNKSTLTDEDAARLIKNNLIIKSGENYKLNFACFTEEQFTEFINMFDMSDEKIDDLLVEWILNVRKNFEGFVPTRLNDQINQWVSCYLNQINGYVIDELIRRGILRKPDEEKSLTDGVFYVEGKYINP